MLARRRKIGFIEFSQHMAAYRRVALSGLGQLEPARCSVQQLGADMAFQRSDRARDRRRRPAEPLAGACQAALIEGRHENPHGVQPVDHCCRSAKGWLSHVGHSELAADALNFPRTPTRYDPDLLR